MTNRRTFLKQSGLLSTGIFLKPNSLFEQKSNLKVGLQLYSVRDYIGKDVKGVIAKVAKAGYTEVETYGYDTAKRSFWGLSPADFKLLLNDNGLTSSSGHYGMDEFFKSGSQDDLKACIEAGVALGQQTIVVPSTGAQYRKTLDDCNKLAANLNKMGEICKQSGLSAGYHNHDTEFKPVEGIMLEDILLKNTDPSLIGFEMDIYWVVRANQDPIQLIKDHPGRFTMWHIKDMDKVKRGINTEVGSGSIDFKEIFKYQAKSGVKHIFMEQENFSMDPYESITQSASYIKNSLLK
jgi:sugar phosphate isomerase/epimerase